jgi:aminoglycoside phosphotransferase (APT) family kinase protein
MKTDTSTQVRAGEELDASILSDFLNKNIVHISQFPGGFSNLTYLLKTDDEQEYVLRRPPFGASAKGGHDMGREFRVLQMLKNAGYEKIPTPLSYEATGTVIGAPFYVMARFNGVILRAKDAMNPALTPSVMRDLSFKLIDNLADLHNIDIEKTGLIQLGKPEGYVKRQVEGWINRYQNAQTDVIEDMDKTADWMRTFQPIEQKPAFIHNDYKFDNVVWDIDLKNIIGVLDWEMATVGDPLMDFGATLAYWCEATDSDFLKMFNISWLNGCPNRQEITAHYAAKTGRNLRDIHFYFIFGLYKNAVIIQQIYARWKKGLTKDPRFSGLIKGVYDLSKMAAHAIITEGV